ncbi:MAG: DUF4382 domain-containing protein [Kofleriaceae bacterium]
MKALAALVALTSACSTEGADTSPRTPTVQVLLTDAPGDFESVWVNITSVAVESGGEWVTLAETPQRLDLLTLQNDVTAALGGAELEPGMYGQLRMTVDSASVVVDGMESPLQIASGAQTGIKINLDQMIETDTTYSLTLDFDAHKSIKTVGQGFLMTPVVTVKDFTASPMLPTESEQDEQSSDPPLL